MKKLGICSVTFRDKTPEELIQLVKETGLDAIEWGGDIHVPPNNLDHAKKVGELTREAGLEVSSYGSYYSARKDEDFTPILETARILGAKSIRIWAGKLDHSKELGKIDEEEFTAITEDIKEQANRASAYDMTLHLEYHGGTYTDTPESAKRLIEAINEPNVRLYWQPAVGVLPEERIKNIAYLQEWISNVHVFHWDDKYRRYPLSEGKEEWKSYIKQLETYPLEERFYLLEFVKDNDPAQFKRDVEVFKSLLT